MPINESELDTIETGSILDKMEDGKFYSFYEISEMILGKKIPEGTHEIVEFISAGQKKPKYETLMANLFFLSWKISTVESVLAARVVRGDIVQGFKEDKVYFGKK